MRDRVRAANSHSKWEWADKMSSGVQIAKEEVKEKISRKRKAENEQPLRDAAKPTCEGQKAGPRESRNMNFNQELPSSVFSQEKQ
jgi:hypothetical protein